MSQACQLIGVSLFDMPTWAAIALLVIGVAGYLVSVYERNKKPRPSEEDRGSEEG